MASGRQQPLVRTVNEGTFTTVFSSLRYNTQYNCCVEVFYADSSENAATCSVGSTQEGGIAIALVNHISTIYVVSGPTEQLS